MKKNVIQPFIINNDYGKNVIKNLKKRLVRVKLIFVTLNFFIIFAALATAIFAIVLTAYFGSPLPIWYPFLTAGIGSFTTFVTLLINFFIVREKIKNYQSWLNKIWIEINKYDSKLSNKYKGADKNWHLFVAIDAILGNIAAQLEVINE